MKDEEAASLLLTARHGGPRATLTIADEAQAYRVQRIVMAQLGSIGGWKVGAAGPDAPPSCAPMPTSFLIAAPAELPAADWPQREIEAEICFIFARGLPPRPAPYTAAEVLDAVGSCHTGFEVLQSRLADAATADALALLADFAQHGAFSAGGTMPNWRKLDWGRVGVTLHADGHARQRKIGNPAGSMTRLMTWLANEGAAWAGGIEEGQIVTCGSWTGKTKLAPGGAAWCDFDGAYRAHIRFPA